MMASRFNARSSRQGFRRHDPRCGGGGGVQCLTSPLAHDASLQGWASDITRPRALGRAGDRNLQEHQRSRVAAGPRRLIEHGPLEH